MSIANWSDEQLNALRQRADPLADALVAKLYEQPAGGGAGFGRLGYNHFLNLTDTMQEAPELVFTNGSELHRQLQAMPEEFVDYFDPLELPAWVDPAKLEMASRMWLQNSLGMLVTLFLGSLPACYLMARGIPALYQTDKLANRRYISQRIYETGLMLDAVMEEGGFKILTDVGATQNEAMQAALNQLDPSGGWVTEGRGFQRKGGAPPEKIGATALTGKLAELQAKSRPKQFLWGAGYITVKKVRFLHASMRYMLKHQARFKPPGPPVPPANLAQVFAQRTEAWDTQSLGLPVNQEDLAYTLLTFGYVIPTGLEQWGWKFSAEQKHAFLHLWRLVGHVLGVEDELMTDDWDEAGRIFRRIQQHQAATSTDGIELTSTVMEFIQDYLPHWFGLNKVLPPLAVRDLIGPEAEKLFTRPVLRDVKRPSHRALWWGFRCVLRCYGWIRRHLMDAFPGAAGLFANLLYRTSEGLIESCRGAYARQPFYVPATETTWVPQYGASPNFMRKLRRWRLRVFNWVFISIAMLITGALGVGAAVVLWWFNHELGWIAALVSGVAFCLSYMSMNRTLPRVFAERPTIEDLPPIENPD